MKEEYKSKMKKATSKEEKKLIKKDYKEMKSKIKKADKIIKKNKLNESPDKFWDQFDIPTFDEFVSNQKKK